MTLNELVPWRKGRRNITAGDNEQDRPFYALQRQMNRLFEDFFGDFSLQPPKGWSGFETDFIPRIDVTEDEKEITVTAELPGIEQKDLEVSIRDGMLTLHGQKKQETEEKQDAEQLYFDGLHFTLNQPEFARDHRIALTLMELIEQRKLLSNIIPHEPSEDKVRVIIGKENKAETIHDYSVVLVRYGLPKVATWQDACLRYWRPR